VAHHRNQRIERVPAVVSSLVVDCRDPARVATFWQTILGGRVVSYPELGVKALRAPGVTFDFVANPDPKTVKNRWHLDLATDDADATIGAALFAGATIAPSFDQSPDFVVMADPEGNEFCVLRHTAAEAPWAPPAHGKP
jgi:predicted enzyme related to lactoylglutathione lyase